MEQGGKFNTFRPKSGKSKKLKTILTKGKYYLKNPQITNPKKDKYSQSISKHMSLRQSKNHHNSYRVHSHNYGYPQKNYKSRKNVS